MSKPADPASTSTSTTTPGGMSTAPMGSPTTQTPTSGPSATSPPASPGAPAAIPQGAEEAKKKK
jgi:hypothetical protein